MGMKQKIKFDFFLNGRIRKIEMKTFGQIVDVLKYIYEFISFLASLRESPQRVSKWGMGCPFLEIKKGRKYGFAVQWRKYVVIYVVIYCQILLD